MHLMYSIFLLWKRFLVSINVTRDWTHFLSQFCTATSVSFLLADTLKSVICPFDIFFHTENTTLVCFCMGCKTPVTWWVAFTQRLHLNTISAVPDIFYLVLRLAELNLVSAELIWFLLRCHCMSCTWPFATLCHPRQRYETILYVYIYDSNADKCMGSCVLTSQCGIYLHIVSVCKWKWMQSEVRIRSRKDECVTCQQSAVLLSVACLWTHLLMCDFLQVISSPL